MSFPKLHFRAAVVLLCMLTMISGIAYAQEDGLLSGAFGEPEAPSAAAYAARAEIGDLRQPIVTLHNEDSFEAVSIEVVAIDEDGHQHRRHDLILEAGGHSVLGLDSLGDFEVLVLSGSAPFRALLEDAQIADKLRGEPRELDVHRVDDDLSGDAFAKGDETEIPTQCEGTWNLTCISPSTCTTVTGYLPGRVEDGDQVYWNLNTPTGPWTTVGSGCSATWYNIQSNGCPSNVYNCYGQTYSIDHNLSPTPKPDLIITNLSVSPSTVTSGQSVLVSYRVTNIGNATVTERFQERISLQPASGPAYEIFLTSTDGTDIPPGKSVNKVRTVTVFGSYGDYQLLVMADAGNAVMESNENNNTSSTPITIVPTSNPEITINGMIYNPGSGGGWTFALQNCVQTQLCTRHFTLESTGTTSAPVYITDNSDAITTVTDNCPSYLAPGQTCQITIQHTLDQGVAKRNGGELEVAFGNPSQPDYEICIEDTNWLCY